MVERGNYEISYIYMTTYKVQVIYDCGCVDSISLGFDLKTSLDKGNSFIRGLKKQRVLATLPYHPYFRRKCFLLASSLLLHLFFHCEYMQSQIQISDSDHSNYFQVLNIWGLKLILSIRMCSEHECDLTKYLHCTIYINVLYSHYYINVLYSHLDITFHAM